MGIALLCAAFLWVFVVGDAAPPATPPEVRALKALFEQDLVEFVELTTDSLLICDPALCGEDYRSNQGSFRSLAGSGGHYGYHGYYPIADSLLPDCQKDLIGDSVTIIYREGMSRGITASVGYYRDECDSWSVCEIMPAESSFPLLGWYEPTLILRGGVKPPQSIRSYDQVTISGDHIKPFQDSIDKVFANIPLSRECLHETAIVLFDYFVASDNAVQDTLYATAHGAQCSFGRWEAIYLLTREDGVWSWTQLTDVRKGWRVFTICCSFDLNSDGLPEFLVWEKANASLYTLVNGRFVRIASAMPHPC